MLTDLKELIEFASVQAEKIFRKTGQFAPMYHCIKTDDTTMIIMSPTDVDKDSAVALMKAVFEIENIDRYVFVDEAWALDDRKAPRPDRDYGKIAHEGLEHHPDRREIIMFLAEDRRGGLQTASRYILRPEHGKAKLAPLVMDELDYAESEGRMVGLLSRE